MKLFPESAPFQLEFDKIRTLLRQFCQSEFGRDRADHLRVHTRIEYVQRELKQSHEYHQLLIHGLHFPNDRVFNLSGELRLLSIPGAVLGVEDLVQLRELALQFEKTYRWFDGERRAAYPRLYEAMRGVHYEKKIRGEIDEVIDEQGQVVDNASPELQEIRSSLYRKRNELRRQFDKIVARLNKSGQLTEIGESYLNGRRVLAVFAEHKRGVKGILHGESESRKTVFIEPEETIGLNNAVHELEYDERKEIQRILRLLTRALSRYTDLLRTWHEILGEFDFIRARALLAREIRGEYPEVTDQSGIHLVEAYHPLLYLYNRDTDKPVVPLSLELTDDRRILVISGPNAGGKTVAMKTVGLLQMMVQSGLLIPVHPSSRFGIFKQIMIHIGDTQSMEFELSTYSSHLLHMKHFMENANGRTLFFIDELGSGSDPALGGAFAEVILRELAHRHAIGIVTTHYLNLKVMAGKTDGIVNGAMSFDEKNLQPRYQLIVGKPGSSYTFSIAERIGLSPRLIAQARKLVDEDQYRLDRLLNQTEQDLQEVKKKQDALEKLLRENELMRQEMKNTMNREKHRQQLEMQKEQSRISEEKLSQLKDLDRKLRQALAEWKKEKNKDKAIRQVEALFARKNEKKVVNRLQRKLESRYRELDTEIRPGLKVMMKKNHQVGEVLEIRGRRAIVKLGMLPMQVDLKDLRVVEERSGD